MTDQQTADYQFGTINAEVGHMLLVCGVTVFLVVTPFAINEFFGDMKAFQATMTACGAWFILYHFDTGKSNSAFVCGMIIMPAPWLVELIGVYGVNSIRPFLIFVMVYSIVICLIGLRFKLP